MSRVNLLITKSGKTIVLDFGMLGSSPVSLIITSVRPTRKESMFITGVSLLFCHM